MARSLSFLICLVLLAAGCQQADMVSSLPSPNYDAPDIVRPVPPAVLAAPAARYPIGPVAPRFAADVPRAWIPPVSPRPWKCIIIHHSATPTGGAAAFDIAHRAKGWDELGYDFVIGNGTDTRDGQIEVGPRWVKQKQGAHDRTPDNFFNEYGIGICLVGNFDVRSPTSAQMRSVARLVAYLMRTYHIPANAVLGHGDTKATDCPGRYMSVATVRRMATQIILADAGTPADPQAAARPASSNGSELMVDVPKR